MNDQEAITIVDTIGRQCEPVHKCEGWENRWSRGDPCIELRAMKQNAKSGAGGQSSVSMGGQECLTHFIYSALSKREVTT